MKSMKKMILATLVGALVFGSIGYSAIKRRSGRKKSPDRTASSNLKRRFSCSSGNVTVENLSTERVRLTDGNGRVYNLILTRSASGEQYSGNGVSIHMKRNDAIFTRNGNDESCTLVGIGNSENNSNRNNHLLRKFMCEGYQDVTVENLSTNKVKLADGYGGVYNLNAATTGSGERYSNGKISIQIKRNDAIYTENGKDKSCRLQKTERGFIRED